jgi:hypothetical protein
LITNKQFALEVTQDDFNDYMKARRAQGKAASTINNPLCGCIPNASSMQSVRRK